MKPGVFVKCDCISVGGANLQPKSNVGPFAFSRAQTILTQMLRCRTPGAAPKNTRIQEPPPNPLPSAVIRHNHIFEIAFSPAGRGNSAKKRKPDNFWRRLGVSRAGDKKSSGYGIFRRPLLRANGLVSRPRPPGGRGRVFRQAHNPLNVGYRSPSNDDPAVFISQVIHLFFSPLAWFFLIRQPDSAGSLVILGSERIDQASFWAAPPSRQIIPFHRRIIPGASIGNVMEILDIAGCQILLVDGGIEEPNPRMSVGS